MVRVLTFLLLVTNIFSQEGEVEISNNNLDLPTETDIANTTKDNEAKVADKDNDDKSKQNSLFTGHNRSPQKLTTAVSRGSRQRMKT